GVVAHSRQGTASKTVAMGMLSGQASALAVRKGSFRRPQLRSCIPRRRLSGAADVISNPKPGGYVCRAGFRPDGAGSLLPHPPMLVAGTCPLTGTSDSVPLVRT